MAKTRASTALKWGTDFGEPIAVLNIEPDQLARRHAIRFRPGYDDLDELRVARIKTPEGGQFALLRHIHAPEPGTEVVALSRSTNVSRDIASILNLLELTHADVVWRLPTAKRSSGALPRGKTRRPGQTRSGILDAIASKTGLSRKHVKKVVGALNALAAAELSRHGEFTLPGMARMRVVKKAAMPARKGRGSFKNSRATSNIRRKRKVLEISALKKLKDAIH
jgi:DNA-binding protein HU-beta